MVSLRWVIWIGKFQTPRASNLAGFGAFYFED